MLDASHELPDEADDEDDDGQSQIVIERPPLREGKIFLDYGDRRAISDNLEAAYVALNQAFRGIWMEKSSEHGWPREYWNDNDVHELDALACDALHATERAWNALTDVVQAHETQRETEDTACGDHWAGIRR